MQEKQRIAKIIARSGICSRREAERLIEARKVKLNGQTIDTPAITVSEKDLIEVNGQKLQKPEQTKLWLFNKPKGCITSRKDPEGRKTVFYHLPKNLPYLIAIGRLDYNTEGLLMFTNDGEFARKIELPSTGWERTYKVRAYGNIAQHKLDLLTIGLVIDGIRYAPAKLNVESSKGDNHWIVMSIKEGKNREIKKMLSFCGLNVNRLIRTSYGPFALNDLRTAQIIEINSNELKNKLTQ